MLYYIVDELKTTHVDVQRAPSICSVLLVFLPDRMIFFGFVPRGSVMFQS